MCNYLIPLSTACLLIGDFHAVVAVEPLKLNGSTMGTYYSVIIDSPGETDADGQSLQARLESRLAEVNRQMSTWDPESEISRFNRSSSTDWFEISPEFAFVAQEAKQIFEATEGAFDPTVAPLIELWGFGVERNRTLPDDKAIDLAKQSVGMQHLVVRLDPPALRKSVPKLQLNLSAIAKGYAVDALAELLTDAGHESFVVDIGGENRAGMAKASGEPWKLGVESPTGDLRRIMKLTKSSIATSGDYRNFFRVDGVVYSHAIDPISGRPVRNPPASVSVIHPSCMTADAWATGMMILGVEKGMQIARDKKLSVMFQEVTEDGTVRESSTGLFAPEEVSSDRSETDQVTTGGVSAGSDSGLQTDQAEGSASGAWVPFAAAAVIFVLAVGGMAIGTILQNKSLKGSCGGLAAMPGADGKSACDLCSIPRNECTNAELREQLQAAAAEKADQDC